MEGIYIPLSIVGGLTILGATIQTFLPGFFSEKLNNNFQAITICMVGITLSFLFLMWFLKLYIREGFQDLAFITRWRDLTEKYKVSEVCALYTDIYDRTLAVEKGVPPDEKTDAQAREAVDAQFAKEMKTKPLSCSLVDEMRKASTMDSFYTGIVKVPNDFILQIHDTAKACRTLLIQAYLKIQESEQRKKDQAEGFEDKPLCDEETAKKKREEKEIQNCMLPEDISTEEKEKIITTKLNQIEQFWKPYEENLLEENKLPKILDDCKYYKGELDKKSQEAKEMSDKYNF